MISTDAVQQAKHAAAKAAADLIQDGMCVGLGTGSTATYFIDYLIDRQKRSGLKIKAVASSERSAKQARDGGIPLSDINTLTSVDIAVDGADEIDHHKRMIKGGGGALLREKIVASMSREMVVIVDESKVVKQLGSFPLPLEITPFAFTATLFKICSLGYRGAMRLKQDGHYYATDNGNYIIDITFPKKCADPEKDQQILRAIPGVLETGFFFGMAGRVLIGHPNGTTTTM